LSILTLYNILLVMPIITFIVGVITLLAGILILAFRASGGEVTTLAGQTSQLAQKGLAEDVAGLVGNATSLLEAMNQMIRTTAGIGVFLTILGLLLMGVSYYYALQIYQTRL
jgi:hypothetical protein